MSNAEPGADLAERSLRRALTGNRRSLALHLELAGLLVKKGELGAGLELIREALLLDHEHVPALLAYARVQLKCGDPGTAKEACRQALQAEPGNADALLMMGRVLHQEDRSAESIAMLRAALDLEPGHERARLFYATILKSAGRFEEARRVLLAMIRDGIAIARAYASLAEIETFTAGHPGLKEMRAIAPGAERGEAPDLPSLRYALGKACEDLGDFSEAFAQYSAGARLKRKGTSYDEAEMFGFFDDVMNVFSRDHLESRRRGGESSRTRPLFIIGMPRSGSTLIERILAGHPDIYSEGERKSFTASFAPLYESTPGLPPFPSLAREMSGERFDLPARSFRAYVDEQSSGRSVFVNKLPGNIFFLGMIHMAMPNARFILTRRDPLDTCLSAFTTLFSEDVPYSYDLAELGRYYRKHEQLVAHWRSVLPEQVLKAVRYEEVVADLEGQARTLTDFAGLTWNPACLDFHLREGPVRTASLVQVRRPLYPTSIGRWTRFEEQLEPLILALAGT